MQNLNCLEIYTKENMQSKEIMMQYSSFSVIAKKLRMKNRI